MQVLVSRERPRPVWRVTMDRHGWCSVEYHGGSVLSRATVDEVRSYLEAAGVDIERDLIKG